MPGFHYKILIARIKSGEFDDEKILEREHQMMLVEFLKENLHPYDFFSNKNEENCSARIGHTRNLMGRKTGVSDMTIAVPAHGYFGFYLELKRFLPANSKRRISAVTPEQKEFLKRRRQLGYAADVSFGISEAIEMVSNYIQKRYEHKYVL